MQILETGSQEKKFGKLCVTYCQINKLFVNLLFFHRLYFCKSFLTWSFFLFPNPFLAWNFTAYCSFLFSSFFKTHKNFPFFKHFWLLQKLRDLHLIHSLGNIVMLLSSCVNLPHFDIMSACFFITKCACFIPSVVFQCFSNSDNKVLLTRWPPLSFTNHIWHWKYLMQKISCLATVLCPRGAWWAQSCRHGGLGTSHWLEPLLYTVTFHYFYVRFPT